MSDTTDTQVDETVEAPAEDAVAYEIPTTPEGDLDFSSFDDAALGELEARIVDEFHARQSDSPSADDIAEMTQLAEDVDAVRAEAAARFEKAEAAQAQVADLAARIGTPDEDAPEADLAVEDAEETLEDEEPAEAVVADGGTERAPIRTRLRGPQLQSGGTVPAAATSVERPAASMVASGTDTMFSPGSSPATFDRKALAEMLATDFRTRIPGERSQKYLARLTSPMPDHLTFDGSVRDEEKWDDLLAPRDIDQLLEHGAMTASGCGPDETIYTHVNDAELGVLVDVPERFFTRGSMEFPETIDTRDFIDQIAGNGDWNDGDASKAVVSFTCPTYRSAIDIRARYLRLEFTNMVARSNPEFYTDVVAKMLLAHEINKHVDTVLDLVSGAGTATPLVIDMTRNVANDADIYVDHAAGSLLTAVEYLVEAARMRWILGDTAAIEGIFPRWVRGAVRASIARKNSDQAYNVTNAEIDGWFRARGVRPQFIDYWQHVPGDFAGREFPADFQAIFYPANAALRGTQGTLDLGSTIRDTTTNADNKYELFREDFYKTGYMAHEPVIATLPSSALGLTYAAATPAASGQDTTAPAHDARGNFDLA